MIRVQMDKAYACCGKEQPNKKLTYRSMLYMVEALPSHLLQCHHVPCTNSLLETNACSLSCHYTVLLLRVAIAARALFEGVTTFDSYQACA